MSLLRHHLKIWLPALIILAVILGIKDEPSTIRIARHFYPHLADPQPRMLFLLVLILLPGYLLFAAMLDVAALAAAGGTKPTLVRLFLYLLTGIDHPSANRYRLIIFGIGGGYLALFGWWIIYAGAHGL